MKSFSTFLNQVQLAEGFSKSEHTKIDGVDCWIEGHTWHREWNPETKEEDGDWVTFAAVACFDEKNPIFKDADASCKWMKNFADKGSFELFDNCNWDKLMREAIGEVHDQFFGITYSGSCKNEKLAQDCGLKEYDGDGHIEDFSFCVTFDGDGPKSARTIEKLFDEYEREGEEFWDSLRNDDGFDDDFND